MPASPRFGLSRRSEDLERDVVGIAERQARSVAGVLDPAVLDAHLVEAGGPLLELTTVDDAERDVRLVERVMAEWSGRIVHRGWPVHERDRTEGGLADRRAGQRQTGLLVQGQAPDGRQLHEEIVRVLPIDEWAAIEGLAHLKDLPVPGCADGSRIEAEHAGEHESPACGLAAGHAGIVVRFRRRGRAVRA